MNYSFCIPCNVLKKDKREKSANLVENYNFLNQISGNQRKEKRSNLYLLAILMKALINFILLTKFDSLQISVTTQNISLFTICNERKVSENEIEQPYP